MTRRVLLLLILLPTTAACAADPPPEGMVLVPAGEFLMGAGEAGADEAPVHRVQLSAFYIDRHEVTNTAFAEFVRSSGSFDTLEGCWFRYCAEGCIDLIAHYQQRDDTTLRDSDAARQRAAVAALREMLPNNGMPSANDRIAAVTASEPVRELIAGQARLPVRGVTWRDARAFACWAGKRLPTEAEWEKAASGTDGRRYPWGAAWDPKRCCSAGAAEAGPAPVGSCPDGASPFGCHDMAGNVWEWVADWYGPEYYATLQGTVADPMGPKGLADGRLPGPSEKVDLLRSARQGRESDTRKVVRGGGWAGPENHARFNARCANRSWSNPSYWHPDVGFRCVKDVE
jgi:sulfatase modifying factor 1